VATNVKERLGVSKQRSHRFHVDRFSLKKLDEVEGRAQYRVAITNGFAGLKSLEAGVDISSAWETVRENINISGFSELIDQRKQGQLQLQNPSKINGDSLNNIICETSRHFRKKKRK
jgi:hypothetical protein